MAKHERTIIVGAGQAGGQLAEALRSWAPDRAITLIGNERFPPYERPPLSKGVLKGEADVESTFLRPASYYVDERIELLTGREVVKIRRERKEVVLNDGAILPYDTLVLATGASCRGLTVTGHDSEASVHYLRDISDALALKERIAAGKRLAVVGAGVIGLEVAASARQLGASVTGVEIAGFPLGRVVPRMVGEWFVELHKKHGVAFWFNSKIAGIALASTGVNLCLDHGVALGADLIVAGIGVVPNTKLASDAGLSVDDGIVVDAFGQTSDESIYAIGDVSRRFSPLLGRHVRLESWHNAQNQAVALAQTLAGTKVAYDELPWFWSDQYDVNFQTIGWPKDDAEVVVRGNMRDRAFSLFFFENNRLIGAHTINQAREMRSIKRIMQRNKDVQASVLGDTSVNLASLAS
jgi:3-phenylpropionate/trans-cinnamate dioxygenase ferredoxin reductase subunit